MAGTEPYVVRGGFTLTLGDRRYTGGEIVDLTAHDAVRHRHMVEPAPEQAPEHAGRAAEVDRMQRKGMRRAG